MNWLCSSKNIINHLQEIIFPTTTFESKMYMCRKYYIRHKEGKSIMCVLLSKLRVQTENFIISGRRKNTVQGVPFWVLLRGIYVIFKDKGLRFSLKLKIPVIKLSQPSLSSRYKVYLKMLHFGAPFVSRLSYKLSKRLNRVFIDTFTQIAVAQSVFFRSEYFLSY